MAYSIPYKFSQKFSVPARDAFKWCTSFDPDDLILMGDSGKRSIDIISDDTLILKDTYKVGKVISKRNKIVCLYPDELFWVSTHLIGSSKYSQFLYKISAESNSSSRLDFTGLKILYSYGKKTKQSISALSEKLKKADSTSWKKLAQEMERDWNSKKLQR